MVANNFYYGGSRYYNSFKDYNKIHYFFTNN